MVEVQPADLKSQNSYHKCKLCDFWTKSLPVMLSHVKKHVHSKFARFSCSSANLEPFECHNCDFKGHLKVVIEKHVSLVHGKTANFDPVLELKTYTCGGCSFETFSLLVFARHRCLVSELEPSSAIKTFDESHQFESADTSSPEKRETNTRPKKTTWFPCQHCTYRTKYRKNMKSHNIRRHELYKLEWLKCEACSYKTRFKYDLKSHTRKWHLDLSDKTWLKCAHCFYKTKSKRNLERHIPATHFGNNKVEKIECELRSYRAYAKRDLATYIRKSNYFSNQVKWFKCEQCPFTTKYKQCLTKHTFCKHTDPKLTWFKCEPRSFKDDDGIKRFLCEQCPFKSKWKASLKMHVLGKHLHSKKVTWYNCFHCSYKTKYKHVLSKHISQLHRSEIV